MKFTTTTLTAIFSFVAVASAMPNFIMTTEGPVEVGPPYAMTNSANINKVDNAKPHILEPVDESTNIMARGRGCMMFNRIDAKAYRIPEICCQDASKCYIWDGGHIPGGPY